MVLIMMVNGNKIIRMEKESKNMLMENSMMENGKMIILTEKENLNLLMDHITKGILKIIKEMDGVLLKV